MGPISFVLSIGSPALKVVLKPKPWDRPKPPFPIDPERAKEEEEREKKKEAVRTVVYVTTTATRVIIINVRVPGEPDPALSIVSAADRKAAKEDAQTIVYFGDAGPVLIRVHLWPLGCGIWKTLISDLARQPCDPSAEPFFPYLPF